MHAMHAARGDPLFRRSQEHVGHVLVFNTFKKPEETGLVLLELHILMVDNGGDASDCFSTATRKKILHFRVPVKGMFAAIEQLFKIEE